MRSNNLPPYEIKVNDVMEICSMLADESNVKKLNQSDRKLALMILNSQKNEENYISVLWPKGSEEKLTTFKNKLSGPAKVRSGKAIHTLKGFANVFGRVSPGKVVKKQQKHLDKQAAPLVAGLEEFKGADKQRELQGLYQKDMATNNPKVKQEDGEKFVKTLQAILEKGNQSAFLAVPETIKGARNQIDCIYMVHEETLSEKQKEEIVTAYNLLKQSIETEPA